MQKAEIIAINEELIKKNRELEEEVGYLRTTTAGLTEMFTGIKEMVGRNNWNKIVALKHKGVALKPVQAMLIYNKLYDEQLLRVEYKI